MDDFALQKVAEFVAVPACSRIRDEDRCSGSGRISTVPTVPMSERSGSSFRSGARSSSDRSGIDGLAACTGGGLAACTSSTCSRNCLVSSCRFSFRKSRGE